ncbi:MAG: hypothetical protein AB7H93_02635 [Vicinamibacterales bacterium]
MDRRDDYQKETPVKRHIGWSILTAVALAAPAAAQEQATVLKRDGSTVSGRFEAWNRNTNTLYIRVSLGDQRIIPLGEAAVIDAEGNGQNLPETELGPARSGDHVLVTRRGEVIRGRLVNIEGGEGSGLEGPRIVSFKPNDAAERRIPFAEMRRLYLGNFPASLSTASPTQISEPDLPAGAIRVPANGRWVGTTVIVGRNDRVAFSATGQVQLSSDPEDRAGAAGSVKGRYAANAPAPTLLAGALIGRIGDGPAFAIGDQTQALPMNGEGQLFLAVNDDEVNDNQGAFAVTMTVTRGRRR